MISHAILARFHNCQFQSADSELHLCAHKGDVDGLRQLISLDVQKTQLDKRNHLGCTPLRLAATGGHTECAKILLEAGSSVDIADVKGQTPLFVAVKNSHTDCAKCLLQNGANVEGSDENVATPLYTAAMNGCPKMVELLLEFGASATNHASRVIRPFGMVPLQIAIAYHQFKCLKLLLRAACNQRDEMKVLGGEGTLYFIAIKQKCDIEYLKLLHEFGLSFQYQDSQGRYPWECDLSGYDVENKIEILNFFDTCKASPQSLKSCCRYCIQQSLNQMNKLKRLNRLSLPRTVLDYLNYDYL